MRRGREHHPAQWEVDAKTNEIPELAPAIEGLDLADGVLTADALHGQRETARMITEGHGAHYVLFIKANQPSLLEAIMTRLNGTDAEFADVVQRSLAGRPLSGGPHTALH